MFYLSSIKSFYSGLGSDYHQSANSFPRLNIDKVKSKLNLKNLAIDRGSAELPNSKTSDLDDVELSVVNYIRARSAEAEENYNDQILTYENRIHQLQQSYDIQQIKSIALEAEGNFNAETRKHNAQLYLEKKAVKEKKYNLERYQTDNDLKTSAIYPQNRYWHGSIILFLVVLETYLNGMFFAQGHDFGIVGGIFTAFVPSLINAVLAYFAGYIIARFLLHRKILKRVVSWFSGAVLVSSVFIMNLLVAHFRSAMANSDLGASQSASIALENFIQSPFNLVDVESWLLLCMGFLCFLIASREFWKMDDPYANYGRISREYDDALNNYTHFLEECIDELSDIKDDSLERLSRASKHLSLRQSEAHSISEAYRRQKNVYSSHLEHLQNACDELMRFYRSENQKNRKTDTPEHFSNNYQLQFPDPKEILFDLSSLSQRFSEQEAQIQKSYNECAERIASSYTQALEIYKSVDELNGEDIDKWLKEDKAPEEVKLEAA